MKSTEDFGQELIDELEHARNALATLRDEIRVKLHLAGMDMKDAWGELNKEAEHIARLSNEEARGALHDVVDKLKAFSRRLDERSH